MAATLGCHFFEAAQVVAASTIDGVHLNAPAHKTLGETLRDVVAALLEALP